MARNFPAGVWWPVRDPRSRRGRRHGWTGLLQLLVLGMAVGSRTLRDVEALGPRVVGRHRLSVAQSPSDTQLERVVRGIDPAGLLVVVQEQVRRMHRARQLPVLDALGLSLVAIDGKALATDRERLHPEAQDQSSPGQPRFVLRALRAVHVGSAVKPVIGQHIIPAGGGETDALSTLLDQLEEAYGQTDLLECYSLDAGFTSRANLEDIHARNRGYIAGLKGNQPDLHCAAVARLGQASQAPVGGWELTTTERRNGRTVTVQFARTRDRVLLWDWSCIRQVWRVHQQVEQAGRVTEEDRYFVTNLPWGRVGPDKALAAVRAHWGIENDANWTFDVVWREDTRAWVRQERAIETLSLFRILAYNMVRLWRHRTLRSSAKTPIPYRRILEAIYLALVAPTATLHEGFG